MQQAKMQWILLPAAAALRRKPKQKTLHPEDPDTACRKQIYPNRLFVLCIYTDSTSPTQIYSISTELPPAE